MRLHDDTVRLVRERVQIVDLFPAGALKRIGSEFVARCPWHDDTRPSLTVSPKTNRAYCFVCARGVDGIGWLQDQDGLTFADSVLRLAEIYNVPIQAADEKEQAKFDAERAERAGLLRRRENQQARYSEALWESPALSYLIEQRGLEVSTIEAWGLGFAANNEEVDDGRVVRVPRCTIPLRDPQGRTIAFTGRSLDPSIRAKYKNSPNDALYQKGEFAFGLDMAQGAIVRSGHVVVVEGQFDVICCWQAGLQNVIAVSGTALTSRMIERLIQRTRAKRITLCFDGDKAGQKAAWRAMEELRDLVLRGELELQILTMPEGKDPADMATTMASLVEKAPHWVEWWFDLAVADFDPSKPHRIAAAEAAVRRILGFLPNGGLREYVQRRAKEFFRVTLNVPAAKVRTTAEINRCKWAERRALRLYLLDPGSRPALSDVAYRDPIHTRAWQAILLIESMGAAPERLADTFGSVLLCCPEEVVDVCRPLVRPIPEVLRVVLANPVDELVGAMEALSANCCQNENTDNLGRL